MSGPRVLRHHLDRRRNRSSPFEQMNPVVLLPSVNVLPYTLKYIRKQMDGSHTEVCVPIFEAFPFQTRNTMESRILSRIIHPTRGFITNFLYSRHRTVN